MPSRIGLTNMGMLLARDVHDIDIRQKEENRWTDVDKNSASWSWWDSVF